MRSSTTVFRTENAQPQLCLIFISKTKVGNASLALAKVEVTF